MKTFGITIQKWSSTSYEVPLMSVVPKASLWRPSAKQTETNQEKGSKMRISYINKLSRVAGLAVGAAFIVAAAGTIKADEAVFKGGAQKLLNPSSANYVTAETKVMACANCATEFVERPVVSFKATEPKTQLVAKHLCGTCETTITSIGHGKATRDVAAHKCGSCAVANKVAEKN